MRNKTYRFKVIDTKTGEITTDSDDMEFVMDGLVSLLLGRYIHHYSSIKMVKYRNNYDGTITIIGYLTNGCRYEITKPEH